MIKQHLKRRLGKLLPLAILLAPMLALTVARSCFLTLNWRKAWKQAQSVAPAVIRIMCSRFPFAEIVAMGKVAAHLIRRHQLRLYAIWSRVCLVETPRALRIPLHGMPGRARASCPGAFGIQLILQLRHIRRGKPRGVLRKRPGEQDFHHACLHFQGCRRLHRFRQKSCETVAEKPHLSRRSRFFLRLY